MKLFRNRENTRKNLSYKIVLLILVILLAGFAVDLFCQRQVLSLPEEERGNISLGREVLAQDGFEDCEQGWKIGARTGRVVIPVDGRFVGRFVVDYDCSHRLDMTWIVWFTGQEDPLIFEDGNSMFIQRTVERLDARVDQIDLFVWQDETDPFDVYLKEFSIINEYQIKSSNGEILGFAVNLLYHCLICAEHYASIHVRSAILIEDAGCGRRKKFCIVPGCLLYKSCSVCQKQNVLRPPVAHQYIGNRNGNSCLSGTGSHYKQ